MRNLVRPITLGASVLLMMSVAHASDAGRLGAISQMFEGADLVSPPKVVDCTLSGGTETTCFSITVRPFPGNRTTGPWCPNTISDGAQASGIWIDRGHAIDADGSFMNLLPNIYDDDGWQVIDPKTGEVNVTRMKEACEAAARPDVDPRYRNHCVQCLPEYVEAVVTTTYTIPFEPVPLRNLFGMATSEEKRGAVGVALDGVRLDGPAPLDAILGAYTIAPFDDCGGHVNLHVGYHYHAVTNCTGDAKTSEGDTSATIGIALDGHVIHAPRLSDGGIPAGLDQCRGRNVGDDYRYHAGEPGSNQILPCLVAEHGCVSNDPKAICDATKRERRP